MEGEEEDRIDSLLSRGKEKERTIPVTVKVVGGEDLEFPCLAEDTTVGELKKLIERQLSGCPSDKQRLIHAGKLIKEDGISISELKSADFERIIVHLAINPVTKSSSFAPTIPSSKPLSNDDGEGSSKKSIDKDRKDGLDRNKGQLTQPHILYINGLPYLALPHHLNVSEIVDPIMEATNGPGTSNAPNTVPLPQMPPRRPQNQLRIHVIRISPQFMSALWTLAKLLLFIYLFSHNASTARLSLMLAVAGLVFFHQIGFFQNINFHQISSNLSQLGGMGTGMFQTFFHVIVPFIATLIPGFDQYYVNQQQEQEQQPNEDQPQNNDQVPGEEEEEDHHGTASSSDSEDE